MKETFTPNEKLTEHCNKLFKGLVKCAYAKDKINIINRYNNNDLEYDGEVIILEFINEAVVVFSNSEWASMSEIDDTIKLKKNNKL
jgi:hypothetical protein